MGNRGRRLLATLVPAVLLPLVVSACVTIDHFSYKPPQTYPAKPAEAPIDVFAISPATSPRQAAVTKPYQTIASFRAHGGVSYDKLQDEARAKARSLGGDAIIYQQGRIRGRRAWLNVIQVWVLRYETPKGGRMSRTGDSRSTPAGVARQR